MGVKLSVYNAKINLALVIHQCIEFVFVWQVEIVRWYIIKWNCNSVFDKIRLLTILVAIVFTRSFLKLKLIKS